MTMTDDRLPRFMVIGAIKAATTWIAHQLRHHPALWLPDAEPHYFSTEYHRGLDWYRGLFRDAPAERIVGEKSADYLSHPLAAARIARLLPGIPLIVQLRNPIDRAYSDYCMLYRRGMVRGDPRSYLDGRRAEQPRFLEGGRYAHHLSRLFEHVSPERVKIILFEDIRARPEAVIAEVCDHIGVAPHLAPEQIGARQNDSRAKLLPLSLRRLLRPMRPVLDPLRTVPLFVRARGAIAQTVRYPPLDKELKGILRAYYRDDVSRLGSMLNRNLEPWLNEHR